jgi:lipoprotein-anchoring transpeptidase ErfK/SrfK
MISFFTVALILLTAQGKAPATATPPRTEAIGIQVALDRAGFSSGVIDGRIGANTKRALEAYRRQHGSDPAPVSEPLVQYRITPEDAAGPFVEEIPNDLLAQSKLPALSYRTVVEALAERFHTSAAVLTSMNSGATFAAGETILVPNVEPMVVMTTPAAAAGNTAAGTSPTRAVGTSGKPGASEQDAVVVRVSRSAKSLSVTGSDGKIVFFAPVTTGSELDPLPVGEWKVNGVQYNPPFRYNPDLFWDADPSHTKATIPPGPNGPVGLVWIDISKEHYGIHGSPEPAQIGRTESHGCVRLTNWDALRVAGLVRPGTQVVFAE